ncbi:MAG: DUF4105 domain-containing protein [Gammaproteobacteria bacterium]|nr:DUF4105 domain-containing protein [Gammaproteobacteria bacterium]
MFKRYVVFLLLLVAHVISGYSVASEIESVYKAINQDEEYDIDVYGESNLLSECDDGHFSDFNELYIAFISPSLNTPMSYFGHSFLILKNKYGWDFSVVISYSANISKYNRMIDILADGASGHMQGEYVISIFHEIKRYYTEVEQRSIIAYKIDLYDDALNAIINEVKAKNNNSYKYDFFTQNCSSEVARLLSPILSDIDSIIDKLLIKQPSMIVEMFKKNGFISTTPIVMASSLEMLFYKYDKLNKRQISLIESIESDPENYLSNVHVLPKEKNHEVYDFIFEKKRIQFQHFNDPGANYSDLISIPHKKQYIDEFPDFIGTLPNTYPSRLSFSLMESRKNRFLVLGFMPSYLNRDELRFSALNESTLKVLNIEIIQSSKDLRLNKLDILELASYNKSFSDISLPTWQFYLGYKDYFFNTELKTLASFGYGVSVGSYNFLASVVPVFSLETSGYTLSGQLLLSYWLQNHNLSYIRRMYIGPKKKNHLYCDYLHELDFSIRLNENLNVKLSFTGPIKTSSISVGFRF